MNVTRNAPCIWTMESGAKVNGFFISVGRKTNGTVVITGETEGGSVFVTDHRNVEIIARERRPEKTLPNLVVEGRSGLEQG